MTVNRSAITAAVFWGSAGLNLGVVVLKATERDYGGAGAQSILVGCLALLLWLTPKISAQLDARLGEAVAQRRMAEIAVAEMERQRQAGDLQMAVSVTGRAERPN